MTSTKRPASVDEFCAVCRGALGYQPHEPDSDWQNCPGPIHAAAKHERAAARAEAYRHAALLVRDNPGDRLTIVERLKGIAYKAEKEASGE